MKVIRLAAAAGLLTAVLGAVPAQANDCTDPKRPCGGCHINEQFSLEDPRPIRCYPT